MEYYVLGAGGMLENGENGGHGASNVGRVQCHRHVDGVVGAQLVTVFLADEDQGTIRGVVELGGLLE